MFAQSFELYLKFNQLLIDTHSSIYQITQKRVDALYEKADIGQGFDTWLAPISAGFHPEPVMTANYYARFPYTKKSLLTGYLLGAESRGWINYAGDVFTSSEKSISLNDEEDRIVYDELKPVEEHLSIDTAHLVSLLDALVKTAAQAVLPLKPTFYFSRVFKREQKYPSLDQVIGQAVSLVWYRDDCHISSWQRHKLPGIIWEALSYIWEGEITTPETLAETLSSYRGYEAEDYASAINQLVALGWVTSSNSQSEITASGRQVREAAEVLTNQYYSKAFTTISKDELIELNQMLETFITECAPAAAEPHA